MASKPVEMFCVICFVILFLIATHSAEDADALVSYDVPQSLELDTFVSVLDLKSLHGSARYRRDVDNVTTPVTVTSTPSPTTTAQATTAGSTVTDTTQRTTRTTTTEPPTTTRTVTTPPVTQAQSTPQSATKTRISLNNHAYYESRIVPESVADHWVDLINAKRHKTLSENHRTAVTIPLSFKFRFYGHNITKVTVATGGFIYASPFLHQWLTATQYIAPLMANFDTTVGKASDIFYDDFGDHFVVQWRDVFLQDQNTNTQRKRTSSDAFNFQVVLINDGTIKFLYKTLPIPVASISKKNHPVKIGLSDAFYIDTVLKHQGVKRRTIYEYHRVSFGLDQIEQGTVIILKPLPTCNIVQDCRTCVSHKDIKFKCQWCNAVGRCSDGFDWKREQWLKRGCSHINSTLSTCNATTGEGLTTSQPVTSTSHTSSSSVESTTLVASSAVSTTSPIRKTSSTVTSPCSTSLSTSLSVDTTRPTSPVASPTATRVSSARTSQRDTEGRSTPRLIDLNVTVTPVNSKHRVQCDENSTEVHCQVSHQGFPVGAVVAVVIILLVVFGGIGVWFFYAYTHPSSTSGLWLIEHRPSQLKVKMSNMKFWKAEDPSGSKYAVETTA